MTTTLPQPPVVIHSVISKHHIYKYMKDASDRVEAAEKLGIPWRIERVLIDIGFGNDAIPAYEMTLTIPENWSSMP